MASLSLLTKKRASALCMVENQPLPLCAFVCLCLCDWKISNWYCLCGVGLMFSELNQKGKILFFSSFFFPFWVPSFFKLIPSLTWLICSIVGGISSTPTMEMIKAEFWYWEFEILDEMRLRLDYYNYQKQKCDRTSTLCFPP